MIRDENIVQLIWVFIFAVLTMVFSCLMLRVLLLYLIEKNVFNLQVIFSNTRLLQSKEEKRVCDALARSLKHTFQDSNIHRITPIQPQFMVSNLTEMNECEQSIETARLLFTIGLYFKSQLMILDPELLIATRAPDYNTVVVESPTMLSTDYFRSNVQPLGVNTSLNRHEDSRGSFGGSSFGSYGSSQDHVPVDRPLFVNTSMSASQRVDLYRRLSDPPKDNEPALTFSSFNHY